MKLVLVFSIAFSLWIAWLLPEDKSVPSYAITSDSTMYYKINAFSVLQNTCNVCHSERNRNAVFTFSNMNAWSAEINEQVFVRQRMPKGNTIVLTEADKIHLRKWLQSLD